MMPVLFIGHGSPTNMIEPNRYADGWKQIAQRLPKPDAILSISAHWYTRGSYVSVSEKPETIYDFYGFSEELYQLDYPAPGAPGLARRVLELCGDTVRPAAYGLDHGSWSVLRSLFPNADVPVAQLSVDGMADAETAFRLGQTLAALRKENILILGSGNVVHNLGRVDFDKSDGYAWAEEFDRYIQNAVLDRRFDDAIHYGRAGECAKLAFPTPDHFLPLLYVLGAAKPEDTPDVFLNECVMGSLSMTSYLFS